MTITGTNLVLPGRAMMVAIGPGYPAKFEAKVGHATDRHGAARREEGYRAPDGHHSVREGFEACSDQVMSQETLSTIH